MKTSRLRIRSRLWIAGAMIALGGCVHGTACLFEQPLRHTLEGRIHFRSFAAADGVDTVPILVPDKTVYVYAPFHNYQCLPATDIQLVGVSEFPEDVIEGSRVTVTGSLFETTSAHQYTPFLMNVLTLLPAARTP